MTEELQQWCNDNSFDFKKFNSKGITLQQLRSAKGVTLSVLAEDLGLKSADRGRFLDAVKGLKDDNTSRPLPPEPQDENAGLYDDPEVVVKGADDEQADYNEFENGDEKEQKNVDDEAFMLRSNFSDDPEDQWDIVQFFDNNEKFKKFKPMLLLQMQIQNSTNYNGNGDGMGQDHNQQLDNLLDSMLGAGHHNDSSSDSDDDIYTLSQKQETRSFRDYISTGHMPSAPSLIYDRILSEYSFEDKQQVRRQETDEKAPFYAQLEYAQCSNLDSEREHFLSMSLQNNISASSEEYRRYKLNCVIVLETSSSMSAETDRQSIANQLVCAILDQLDDDDKFCLIAGSENCNIEHPLDDIKSTDCAALKKKILSFTASGGPFELDEGYNAALGQLQEYFDAQLMAATNADEDDEEENKDECVENRILIISDTLPNSDSSLMDLMQVYSDSDENKIYTSFISVSVQSPSHKLVNNVYKLRGCNFRQYVLEDGEDEDDDEKENKVLQQFKSDWKCIVNPIFFNISLTLKQCKIDTVYGYHNNMKKISKLNSSGNVKTMKTFFLDERMMQQDKSEVITVRLQPPEDETQAISLEYELHYEHRDGKVGELKQEMTLSIEKEKGVYDETDDAYFDSTGMRKRVLLIRYVEFLNDWLMRSEKNEQHHLNVEEEFKARFSSFLSYFEAEMKEVQDDQLQQEVAVLKQLIDFNENAAAQLRESSAT